MFVVKSIFHIIYVTYYIIEFICYSNKNINVTVLNYQHMLSQEAMLMCAIQMKPGNFESKTYSTQNLT